MYNVSTIENLAKGYIKEKVFRELSYFFYNILDMTYILLPTRMMEGRDASFSLSVSL